MPTIDMGAKAFETRLAAGFAWAVSTRRRALKLTASDLSKRTAELGYPISRAAIAKIESNLRSGKIDVAEVLVLAVALDVPPVLLLFPQASTDGAAKVLPNFKTKDDEAVRWMAGEISFPQPYNSTSLELEGQPNPPNHGVDLIAAMHRLEDLLDERTSLVHYQEKTRNDSAETEAAQRMLEKNNEQIAAARKQKRDAREALWGMRRAVGEQKGLEEEFVGTAENPEDESDG